MLLNCGVGEDSWESLGQLVYPNGNQSWTSIGKTDVEAETPILWLPGAKNWLIRKDPVAGKDLRWEEKGMTEDEMVGWHHRLNGLNGVWVSSGSWWWTGRPGVLQSLGLQRVGHDWETELNWTEGVLGRQNHIHSLLSLGMRILKFERLTNRLRPHS